MKVLDFSPDWDYCSGGAKILICLSESLDGWQMMEPRFSARFGKTEVPVKFIQASVLKCNSPPNVVGYYDLELLYNG